MANRVADPRGQRTQYAAGAELPARIDEHLLVELPAREDEAKGSSE
jgi:hypothetical protein